GELPVIRKRAVWLFTSLLLAGVPLAAQATPVPQDVDQGGDLATKVSTTRDKLDHSKQRTEDLQRKVDDLQSRNDAAKSELEQRDETIAKLREQLRKLQDDDAEGTASDSP